MGRSVARIWRTREANRSQVVYCRLQSGFGACRTSQALHNRGRRKSRARRRQDAGQSYSRAGGEHVEQKRKPGTAAFYRHVLNKIKSELGATKADKVTRATAAKLHSKLRKTPFQANRVLAAIGSMYAFAGRVGVVPEGMNPARRIEKFKEHRRERFLTGEELQRLRLAIREAETKGIPWDVDEAKPKAKHLPKARNRFTKIDLFAAAALRLLLFTGCRLREILNLKWENVDIERGSLFLADSKTGKKTIILNAPALAVLNGLIRIGSYVVPGDIPEKPRADLKRPWEAVSRRAGFDGVRLHDLRHTYASFGAGGGLGLPIIGKRLGHTQASTTARYAHLGDDPLRRGAEHIGGRISEAMGEPIRSTKGAVISMQRR